MIPLRPLSVGEILDGIFTTIRTNPGATLGLTVGVSAVVETISTVTAIVGEDSSNATVAALDLLVFGLNAMLGIFLSGVLAVVVSEAALGSRISAGAAVRRVTPRLGGLLVLTLVVTLLSVLGLLALIVGAVAVAIYLCLASPAYVLEGQTIRAALRRSRVLVRGSWWRTFGVVLLSSLVGGVLVFVFTMVTLIVLATSEATFGDAFEGDLTVAGYIVTGIGNLIATTVATPVLSGAIVLLYIDQRIRREGLDVTLAETARQRATAS
ncbi:MULTISPECIES: glycerophosphoryl diester phosphodiesterase membrane domain-containing protein [Parafrankia]|uniref:glycerophosphoryl diester phosphodiesterase membrane domain-containing protein n=1 Tax=Parafrankia TaxID=2994362 RepID=UPI00036DA1C0|nr:glycerophosphoryl diester phosphodiesterase membrane domain-containing protein [Parafrankia elaeagni]